MKIIGNVVGTTLPKPDMRQTDPTKGDYIKGKPDFKALAEKEIAERTDLSADVQESLVKADTAVLVVEQELTDEQKAQARENIGAISADDVQDCIDGIDVVQAAVDDLAANVAYIDAQDNENVNNPEHVMTSVVVDSVLSEHSMNPIQNQAITRAINSLEGDVSNVQESVARVSTAVLSTEQTLTPDEQAQARTNISAMSAVSEDDAFELAVEIGLIDPVADKSGQLFTDKNGALYTF